MVVNSGGNDYFPETDDELPEHALFIGDLSRSVDEVKYCKTIYSAMCSSEQTPTNEQTNTNTQWIHLNTESIATSF